MLVHKKSRGILEYFPVARGDCVVSIHASFKSLERAGIIIDKSEWWEVPNASPMATQLRRYYPEFEPVEDAETGKLVQVIAHYQAAYQDSRKNRAKEREELRREMKADAERRGFLRTYAKTTVQANSMDFLRDTLQSRANQKE